PGRFWSRRTFCRLHGAPTSVSTQEPAPRKKTRPEQRARVARRWFMRPSVARRRSVLKRPKILLHLKARLARRGGAESCPAPRAWWDRGRRGAGAASRGTARLRPSRRPAGRSRSAGKPRAYLYLQHPAVRAEKR